MLVVYVQGHSSMGMDMDNTNYEGSGAYYSSWSLCGWMATGMLSLAPLDCVNKCRLKKKIIKEPFAHIVENIGNAADFVNRADVFVGTDLPSRSCSR